MQIEGLNLQESNEGTDNEAAFFTGKKCSKVPFKCTKLQYKIELNTPDIEKETKKICNNSVNVQKTRNLGMGLLQYKRVRKGVISLLQ